jgi:hypothetical protein
LADSVRGYLQQISKIALLTAEEEVDLAKRIEAGLYAAQRLRGVERESRTLPGASIEDVAISARRSEVSAGDAGVSNQLGGKLNPGHRR